jgi:hypothetical protein
MLPCGYLYFVFLFCNLQLPFYIWLIKYCCKLYLFWYKGQNHINLINYSSLSFSQSIYLRYLWVCSIQGFVSQGSSVEGSRLFYNSEICGNMVMIRNKNPFKHQCPKWDCARQGCSTTLSWPCHSCQAETICKTVRSNHVYLKWTIILWPEYVDNLWVKKLQSWIVITGLMSLSSVLWLNSSSSNVYVLLSVHSAYNIHAYVCAYTVHSIYDDLDDR